jgi:tRNA nucleotidyltransferase (CCA-adding enzyme)
MCEIVAEKTKYPVPQKVIEFANFFEEKGFSLYIVGGAVRDYLLGIPNSDFDFCTNATPQQVISLFKKVIPTGIKHGTVTVLFKGESYEVTTFRAESNYTDGRHPDNVTYVTDLHDDLSRRDFTINALAANCKDGTITDDFCGLSDLSFHLVRAIGNPTERFKEDGLRLMRLARFCSKLGFNAEATTLEAATELCSLISNVSQERIFDELSKILMTSVPSVGLKILEKTGILALILPELTACRQIKQTKVNASDVLEHIYLCVDEAAKAGYCFEVRLAALLHDIGKPSTMTYNKFGILRFPGHEEKGSRMAVDVLKRLKCSNQLIDDVSLLIREHTLNYSTSWSDGTVKRFIRRVGKDKLDMVFQLQYSDQIASIGEPWNDQYADLIPRIEKLINDPMYLSELAVTGEDLNSIGIPKSKEMGEILNKLLEMVIDYPTLNQREILLNQASLMHRA